MSDFGRLMARSMDAAADMRTNQWHILRAAAAGTTNVASNPAGQAADVIGVLFNKPNSGQAASVIVGGESKVVAGGSITANTLLTTNGSGRAAAATSGDFILGMALEAASADGEVIRVQMSMPAHQLPSSLNA